MAISSPISIVLSMRCWDKKNINEPNIINIGKAISDHEALASGPIVQNLIVIILSEFAPIEIIKLENALNRALTTAPDNIKLVVVNYFPIEAIKRTTTVEITEPKKAPIPVKDFKPSIIKKVAPKVAPEEIPSIYGSEIGLFTVVCITEPQIANPAPTIMPIITLGTLIFQTIAIIEPDKLLIFTLPDIFEINILKVSFKLICTAPRDTDINAENIRDTLSAVSNTANLKLFLVFNINTFV